jgi:hypothetical protein
VATEPEGMRNLSYIFIASCARRELLRNEVHLILNKRDYTRQPPQSLYHKVNFVIVTTTARVHQAGGEDHGVRGSLVNPWTCMLEWKNKSDRQGLFSRVFTHEGKPLLEDKIKV